MAETVGEPLVLSLLDARMGEVYSATCTVSGEGDRKAGELSVGPPATLAVPVSGNWIACGNALAAYPELAERLRNAGFALRPEIVPEAAAVARLAACRLKEGAGIDPALAAPLYIRDKVARTTRERLEAGGRA